MPLYNRQFIEELNGLSIETVAVKLGLKVMKHRSLCPWHSDHTPSLTYNIQTKKNYCHCFVCGKGGGPITLTMQVENCSFPDHVPACFGLNGRKENAWILWMVKMMKN